MVRAVVMFDRSVDLSFAQKRNSPFSFHSFVTDIEKKTCNPENFFFIQSHVCAINSTLLAKFQIEHAAPESIKQRRYKF